jgi:hypothetical protein
MKQDTFEGVVRILLLLFAVKIVTKILQGLQIFDTEADRLEAEAKREFLRGANSPVFGLLFAPENYWQKLLNENNPRANEVMQQINAQNWKQAVYQTKGIINDDEDELFALFGELLTLDHLAWVSYYFKYLDQAGSDTEDILGTSLGAFLAEYLDAEDMVNLATVLTSINGGSYRYPSLSPNI